MTSPRIENVSAFEGYERWAGTYDETANPVVAMDARHSLRVLSPEPGELILDAGCGTGRHLQLMEKAGATGVGLDFSPAMLRVAHRRAPSAGLAVADLQGTLPLQTRTFDGALCALVGEHLEKLQGTFKELRRVLKPRGRLVFSVYHPDMAEAGIEANFLHDGVEYRLGAQKHSVQDYLDAIAGSRFDQIGFRAFKGNAALAEEIPAAQRYLGKPVLLIIIATASAR